MCKRLLPDTQMYTVYRPICLHKHTHIHKYNCYKTHTQYYVLCTVLCRACSSSSSECYLLLSVCVTGLVTLGLLHTPYHWERQQPPRHTHKYTHAQTYMHTYHTQAKSVVENLQTIKEMAILSSHNKEDKALKMVS